MAHTHTHAPQTVFFSRKSVCCTIAAHVIMCEEWKRKKRKRRKKHDKNHLNRRSQLYCRWDDCDDSVGSDLTDSICDLNVLFGFVQKNLFSLLSSILCACMWLLRLQLRVRRRRVLEKRLCLKWRTPEPKQLNNSNETDYMTYKTCIKWYERWKVRVNLHATAFNFYVHVFGHKMESKSTRNG